MARYLLDSSALVKHYHAESGTVQVEHLFSEPGHQRIVSRLAIVEACSCFARLLREGTLSEPELTALVARLEEDVASGELVAAALSGSRLERAAVILVTHGQSLAVRTLDAIHLATAQSLDRPGRTITFVAADKQLLKSAAACGLTILDVG